LVGLIRYGVHEPARWQARAREQSHRPTLGTLGTMSAAFLALFSPRYARRTLLNSTYLLVSIVGLWAGVVYVPASITQIAAREGYRAADAARLASYGT